MKKLIAKTKEGTEFFHSKTDAFFAASNAQKIADTLNGNCYKLGEGEKWHVYDYDYSQDAYVNFKIYISKGVFKAKAI